MINDIAMNLLNNNNDNECFMSGTCSLVPIVPMLQHRRQQQQQEQYVETLH